MVNKIFPWHDTLWSRTLQMTTQDRLPHALLLCGPQGMGKSAFAQRLTDYLLCQSPDEQGNICGQCKSCLLLKANNHPDLKTIIPTNTSKTITVDQIRALIQFCNLTANYNRYQIVIITPAESMNRNAANSLLKLLEEPPSNTLILLISHRPMALMATIRSRCQRLDFSRPELTTLKNWLHTQLSPDVPIDLLLNLSNQAPLAALSLVETEGLKKRQTLFNDLSQLVNGKIDPIRVVENWQALEATQLLSWLISWTMDLIRFASTQQTVYILNQEQVEHLQRWGKQLSLSHLYQLLDLQQEALRFVMNSSTIRLQGLLELIALTWIAHRR